MLLRMLAAALALVVAMPAVAQERITNFVSDVHVQADGALDVVETISLVSDGSQIKRGIQRDFPTTYPGRNGGRMKVGFKVLDVQRDGHREPYRLIAMQNGERIRIGDADTLLPPGDHVFRIHYRTTRQIGFYRDFDELYWNATGTDWVFPIEHVEARITLPKAVPFGQRAVYTGVQGAIGHDAVVTAERPGQIVFRTTRPLEASEGLTIAAAWRKGVVAEPGALTRFGWGVREKGPLVLAIAGLLAILLHCARALWRARRNPDPRPIVPSFSPPDDLSAAAIRYIWRKGSDDRTFAAAIVDAGVRGRLRIVEKWPGRKPDRVIEQVDARVLLPAAEKQMCDRLFDQKNAILLQRTSHAALIGARHLLNTTLEANYGGDRFFTDQPKKTLHGWALVFGLSLVVALFIILAGSPAPLMGLGLVGVIIVLCVGVQWLSRKRAAMPDKKGGRRTVTWIGTVLLFLALFQFTAGLMGMAISSGNGLPLLAPLIALPIVALTRLWLTVPTAAGWALRDRILGFRQYLAITEEDRLEALNPPEKTAALFERYLPYAMALGVENKWAKRFTGVLSAASIDGSADRSGSSWYVGRTPVLSNPSAFATAIGSSLTSTIASAATAPGSSGGGSSSGSSSGSSGGGSSGGGGGGGGGSGW